MSKPLVTASGRRARPGTVEGREAQSRASEDERRRASLLKQVGWTPGLSPAELSQKVYGHLYATDTVRRHLAEFADAGLVVERDGWRPHNPGREHHATVEVPTESPRQEAAPAAPPSDPPPPAEVPSARVAALVERLRALDYTEDMVAAMQELRTPRLLAEVIPDPPTRNRMRAWLYTTKLVRSHGDLAGPRGKLYDLTPLGVAVLEAVEAGEPAPTTPAAVELPRDFPAAEQAIADLKAALHRFGRALSRAVADIEEIASRL